MGILKPHSARVVIWTMEEEMGRGAFWAGALPDVLLLHSNECLGSVAERSGVSMCDKKSIRELREEAELKKLWKKACDTTNDESSTDPGIRFIEENFR